MAWLVDGPGRRVSNDELGLCLVEGKGWDGDIEFTLLDKAGRIVLGFFTRSDYGDDVHNGTAPAGTNYSVVVAVFNVSGIGRQSEITVNNDKIYTRDLIGMVADALSRAVAMYDLGFPKYVRVDFKDDWLSERSSVVFLQRP